MDMDQINREPLRTTESMLASEQSILQEGNKTNALIAQAWEELSGLEQAISPILSPGPQEVKGEVSYSVRDNSSPFLAELEQSNKRLMSIIDAIKSLKNRVQM